MCAGGEGKGQDKKSDTFPSDTGPPDLSLKSQSWCHIYGGHHFVSPLYVRPVLATFHISGHFVDVGTEDQTPG